MLIYPESTLQEPMHPRLHALRELEFFDRHSNDRSSRIHKTTIKIDEQDVVSVIEKELKRLIRV